MLEHEAGGSRAIVEVTPFRGLRYDPEIVSPDDVIAPPYDVVGADQIARLHARSPYNVAQVESPTGSGDARYGEAAAALQRATEAGALRRDARPSYYVYEQVSSIRGHPVTRRCFFARLRLSPYEEGQVRPHESTMSAPKADRLALLRATRTNVSPIFVMFSDGSGAARAVLEQVAAGDPAFAATDDRGDTHRLWVIDDPGQIETLTRAAAGSAATIADGHHRYETALAYLAEQPDDLPADAPKRYVLAGLVAEEEPGLVILPTHRVLPSVELPSDFEEQLGDLYTLSDVAADGVDALYERVAERADDPATFGMLASADERGPARMHLLTARSADAVDAAMPADWSHASRELDVLILNETILEPLLGVDADARAAGAVEFTEEPQEAWDRVRAGDCRVAFLVNATRVDQVVAVADAGEVLPQKSTFYYPKLATGMVLNPLDDDG